jgi:hypothetical protein
VSGHPDGQDVRLRLRMLGAARYPARLGRSRSLAAPILVIVPATREHATEPLQANWEPFGHQCPHVRGGRRLPGSVLRHCCLPTLRSAEPTSTVSRCRTDSTSDRINGPSLGTQRAAPRGFPALTRVSPLSVGTLWGQAWGQRRGRDIPRLRPPDHLPSQTLAFPDLELSRRGDLPQNCQTSL